jgi:hypothetical protein
MPSYGQTVTLQFVAWDTSANAPKTGDAGNFTLKWIKDGTAATPTNVPATEVDATNAKGIYKIVMTGTEASCQVGTICGVSSAANVVILPLTVTFENLPIPSPGAANGVFIAGTNAATVIPSLTTHLIGTVDTVTTLTTLPAITTNWLTGVGTDATHVTKVQVGLATPTNITAATGVTLAAAGLDAITTTAPTGPASTYPAMQVQLWRRQFKKTVKSLSGLSIKTYADDGNTVVTTQTFADDLAGNETLGASS